MTLPELLKFIWSWLFPLIKFWSKCFWIGHKMVRVPPRNKYDQYPMNRCSHCKKETQG